MPAYRFKDYCLFHPYNCISSFCVYFWDFYVLMDQRHVRSPALSTSNSVNINYEARRELEFISHFSNIIYAQSYMKSVNGIWLEAIHPFNGRKHLFFISSDKQIGMELRFFLAIGTAVENSSLWPILPFPLQRTMTLCENVTFENKCGISNLTILPRW